MSKKQRVMGLVSSLVVFSLLAQLVTPPVLVLAAAYDRVAAQPGTGLQTGEISGAAQARLFGPFGTQVNTYNGNLSYGPSSMFIAAVLPINVSLTFGAGGNLSASTSSFALDMSSMTQFDGAFTFLNFTQDGLAQSNLRSISFDSAGHVLGNFEDGTARRVYKLALATFSNPNALEARNGNVYGETTGSGTPRSVFADVTGIALLQPNTVELSNVDLAGQFTSMIKVQQAYNSSATSFKTIDEMTIVARDLKA